MMLTFNYLNFFCQITTFFESSGTAMFSSFVLFFITVQNHFALKSMTLQVLIGLFLTHCFQGTTTIIISFVAQLGRHPYRSAGLRKGEVHSQSITD